MISAANIFLGPPDRIQVPAYRSKQYGPNEIEHVNSTWKLSFRAIKNPLKHSLIHQQTLTNPPSINRPRTQQQPTTKAVSTQPPPHLLATINLLSAPATEPIPSLKNLIKPLNLSISQGTHLDPQTEYKPITKAAQIC